MLSVLPRKFTIHNPTKFDLIGESFSILFLYSNINSLKYTYMINFRPFSALIKCSILHRGWFVRITLSCPFTNLYNCVLVEVTPWNNLCVSLQTGKMFSSLLPTGPDTRTLKDYSPNTHIFASMINGFFYWTGKAYSEQKPNMGTSLLLPFFKFINKKKSRRQFFDRKIILLMCRTVYIKENWCLATSNCNISSFENGFV